MIRKLAIFLLFLSVVPLAAEAAAQNQNSPERRKYPRDVQSFLNRRNTCDHFRGESFEGNSPEQRERRTFIIRQLERYCTGTDKQLAALTQKYRGSKMIMEQLNQYEDNIEGQ